MVGVTPQIMRQGMRADYKLVDALSQSLCERMPHASRLRVETPSGTAFIAHLRSGVLVGQDAAASSTGGTGRTCRPARCSRRRRRSTASLSATARPATTSGRNTAICAPTPLTLEIAGGRLQSAHCARKDLEREFWDYCHTDEHSDRVGELAFGTNLALSEMIGVLLQDEKIPGVHIAFGDPYGSQTGAPGNRRRTSTS